MAGGESSWPVTVTVCATFQFTGVKTTDEGATVPSAGLELAIGIVTSAEGAASRTMVKAARKPVSVVTRPATGETVKVPGTTTSGGASSMPKQPVSAASAVAPMIQAAPFFIGRTMLAVLRAARFTTFGRS